jgi:hypothetical protein
MYNASGADHPFALFADDTGSGYVAEFGIESAGIKQSFALPQKVRVIGVK